MEANVRSHPLWLSCTEEEWEVTQEGLEKFVCSRIHSSVFAKAAKDWWVRAAFAVPFAPHALRACVRAPVQRA